MRYEYLASEKQFAAFCAELRDAPLVAFDTEFVSEDTYRPELCLVQVAAAGRLVIIDPQQAGDLAAFWDVLTQPGHETVVHAGRQEFLFCLAATGQRPARWFDVQLAAGFIGLEHPAALSTLVARLLGRSLPKAETRTNWRRRPLSPRQLEYAAHDVAFLEPLRTVLRQRIEQLGRLAWLEDELLAWQEHVDTADPGEGWRRVSGISGLNSRQLAIVRALWQWRDQQADARNCPPRRVLRDDLIVELARRQTYDLPRLRAIRGMEHRHLQRHLPELAQCVRQACELEGADCPGRGRNESANSPQLQLLGQFLATALSSLCRSNDLAPSLVATVQDLRDLVAFRLGFAPSEEKEPPALARGWRAEVVGRVIDDLLSGRLAVRVEDPLAENPLQFERLADS